LKAQDTLIEHKVGGQYKAQATPLEKLDAERANYEKLWQGDTQYQELAEWGELEKLEPLTAERLRHAASRFKFHTSAVDGWHPKHFAWLSDAALKLLAAILMLVEEVGDFPSVMQDLVVMLLSKPTGGLTTYRVIQILVSVVGESAVPHMGKMGIRSGRLQRFRSRSSQVGRRFTVAPELTGGGESG